MRRWLTGLVGGAVALVMTGLFFPIGIAMFAATAFLKPWPAAAGGAFVTWGAAFLLEMRRASDGCVAFSRQPNASCTMGDNTPFLAVGLAVLTLGLLLTGLAVARARAQRL